MVIGDKVLSYSTVVQIARYKLGLVLLNCCFSDHRQGEPVRNLSVKTPLRPFQNPPPYNSPAFPFLGGGDLVARDAKGNPLGASAAAPG